jgi:uncharacterized protein YdeI (YjbR/CyaY-like superfamily)
LYAASPINCDITLDESDRGYAQPKNHYPALASPVILVENIPPMPTKDKRVDVYIEKSAEFAKPILRELRSIVHEGCPDVEETMKWSMPFFLYKGILCNMASFKEHCAFGFWKASLILETEDNQSKEAMGQLGRITSVKDLPSRRKLLGYVKKAMKLHDDGIPSKPKPKAEKKELTVPDYFMAAVKRNKKALTTFDSFPYSKKKEYVEWVTEAKSDETRDRRLKTSVEWLSEGKSRNWKYENC